MGISYLVHLFKLSNLNQLDTRYKIKLDSDALQYGGHGRLDLDTEFFAEPVAFKNKTQSIEVRGNLKCPFYTDLKSHRHSGLEFSVKGLNWHFSPAF